MNKNYLSNYKIDIGTKVSVQDKVYIVENCRVSLEFLGEPKGFVLTLKCVSKNE